MDRNDQAWAVFRCQLLAPVLLGEVSASERGAYFRMLSEQAQLLPNGTRKTTGPARNVRPAGVALRPTLSHPASRPAAPDPTSAVQPGPRL